jgi:hypothetical protein
MIRDLRYELPGDMGRAPSSFATIFRPPAPARSTWNFTSGRDAAASGPFLHIGAAGRHAELLAADLRQHGDALANLLMRRTCKA